ncbi:MAG: NAD(P)H-hydrate dehydratase [Acidimicrobiales bacterium]|nr:NAD(P)H-hydrate dehydratase [Acidimicrobiales bacterium]
MEAIVTPSEMAAVDAAAPEPVEVLVERAGWAVAREAVDMLGGTYGRRVVVVAGKGNNGADGRSAGRFLRRRGVRVSVLDASALHPDYELPDADLVIDAAYGTGFRGVWRPPRLPRSAPPVLAVDIPSGVVGLTGEVAGGPWPADRTVTFAAWKPGLLFGAGADLAGRVVVADIGLDVSGASSWLVDVGDLATWAPARPRESHKWRNAVWIVAGSAGMTGAAHLSTRAALRSGAGYVRLSTPGTGPERFSGGPTEAVLTSLKRTGWASVVAAGAERFGALAVGPGLGVGDKVSAEVREVVAKVGRPIVVDGDGLRALGRDADRVVAARAEDAGPVVLTPHDGEFELLTGSRPGADRISAARNLAAGTGAVVLLKGSTTVVAAPDGTVFVSNAGDQRLATAGTGDVLTGVVVALLAQGLPAPIAAVTAAVLHGRAASLGYRRGLVAGDLPDLLPAAQTEAFDAETSSSSTGMRRH